VPDISIGCVEVPIELASQYGVMTVDEQARIVSFDEKPAEPKPALDRPGFVLASMGIYAFNASFLFEQLIRDAELPDSSHDFGRDIIPYLIGHGYKVYAHRFGDSCVNIVEGRPYWRDVGTDRRVLGGEPRPDARHAGPQSLRRRLADLDAPGAAAAGEIRVRERAAARRRVRFAGIGRLHHQRLGGAALAAVLERARAQLLQHRGLGHPARREVHRHVVLRNCVVDRYCTLPAGLEVGVDPEQDRKRFFVTDRGVTLVTPEMLGQDMHHLP
jgi:glucose-1-phosphate adenylyltransferase